MGEKDSRIWRASCTRPCRVILRIMVLRVRVILRVMDTIKDVRRRLTLAFSFPQAIFLPNPSCSLQDLSKIALIPYSQLRTCQWILIVDMKSNLLSRVLRSS